ncbi:prevent-host-death family protein [Actinacidiphila yanglinensis]|uniref:Prevent-host-death family protein n=1 Tax=Actinacidiphila yanglinensis TaxID=310779 RepID=A0A1H6DKK8_9ACTN|nr:prevent-host-death family protein [Actinacidiphila yanglinensis]SEG91019.1 prevent-host-death family protein [Actinacidiphila yanglinensis]
MPAHQLVTPPRGGLAEKSGRRLRLALQAAAQQRTSGSHWHVLLTAPRSAFGGPRSTRAEQTYQLLERIVTQCLHPGQAPSAGPAPAQPSKPAPEPAPVTDATSILTEPATEHDGLTHETAPAQRGPSPVAKPAPSTGPAQFLSQPAAAPARPGDTSKTAPDSSDTVRTSATATTAQESETGTAVASAPSATPPSATLARKLLPGPPPATLHEARAALPQFIRAAADGTPTPLARDTDHALLMAPTDAAALGWDLTGAEVHGIADARKKLGDLIRHASQGRPQLLRRHNTPVAVLIPAVTESTPHPATTPGPRPSPAEEPSNDHPTPRPPNGLQPQPDLPVPLGSAPHPAKAPAPSPSDAAARSSAHPSGDLPTELAPQPAVASAPAAVPDSGEPGVPRRLAPLDQALDTVLISPAGNTTTDTAAPPHGLPTGIPSLDQALGGLQPGRFYLVAAAPGAGGSLIASSAARTTALDHRRTVLYAASGLSRADVAARIVAAHLSVDYRRLRTGQLTTTEQTEVSALYRELPAAPLFIDDGSDLTPAAIAESATGLLDLALVVVDRLQAADDPRLPLSGPRLTDAAQALAHLARTLHIPVLAAVDTDHADTVATLSLDTTLTLTPDTGNPHQTHLTITERDLGTQAVLTLHADLTHARLTEAPPHAPSTRPTPTQPAAAHPAPPAPAGTPGAWPPTATPGNPTPPAASAQQPPPTPTPPAAAAAPEPARQRTPQPPGSTTGGYAGRDYSYFTGQITRAVDQALADHAGDVETATEALAKKAVPHAMALFEETRVGSNYEHTVYPETLEFLRKKTKEGADQVWEGRHNWTNTTLIDSLNNGTLDPVTVDALDTNAAYLSAFKTYLPIGTLQHNPDGGFDPKRSGIYLLTQRPTWHHPHLPDPIGNRHETGPVLLTDSTIRLLLRCARYGLCDPPAIAESWTSGASEGLLEKFRRVLTEAREAALAREAAGYADGAVTVEYVKAMYAKFTSTMGESNANLEIRRPEWMHIIRSQAFANLWYKANKAHEAGLTIVRVRGTDELHLTGGPWRKTPGQEDGVFPEGRLTQHMKLKDRYTLPRKTTA